VDTPYDHKALQADYVVACYGARSPVRALIGEESKGRTFHDRFLIADVKMEAEFPSERRYWFDPPFHRNQSALLHRQPDNVWRIDFQLGADADPELEKKPERVIPRIQALLGQEAKFNLEWVSVYTFSCSRMKRFRHGRILFAGDAAHCVSPFGARGANSGVQDAENLAWKLALVLSGKAPETLLDSYDEERRPVGERLLRFTDRLFSIAASANPIVIWLRNRIMPLLAPRMMATPARRKLAFRFISQLGISYRGSAITGDDAGERAPDAVIGDQHLHDAFVSPLHHLVVFGDGATFARAAEARFAGLVDTIVVDDATARRRYDVARDGWVLVRPDGYVAARAQALDDGPLDAYSGARIGVKASKRST